MLKKWFLLFFCLLITNINAQENNDKKAIKKVISTFFKGLHQGDSTIMRATLHKDIKIQTTSINKEGTSLLTTESRLKLLTSIANKNPKHVYLEKLLSYQINVDTNLASVWTPYEFYFNGKFSHCGANSFQLFKEDNQWKIIYLVDIRRRENCKPLNEKN
ncbi:nuclear transport factor 2 family protein [Polaribacter sp.]|uniref:nuclear transport factor 2 family protein n=1 Tax=Polaribacter sp. TaxID=1920175 RepID=UPI003F6BD0C6